MAEPDVLYSDVVFLKSRGNAGKDEAPSAPETNYASVKVAKTQSDPQHDSNGKPARSKLTVERAALLVLCILLTLALVALCCVAYLNVQGRNNLQNLKAEHKAWKASQSDPTNGVCRRCDWGWELYGKSCYWFSSINLTWEGSRRVCQHLLADLVKIDTQEEQRFVERQLRDKMDFEEDKFWIGLTDAKQEAQWLWADGSPLNLSLNFWSRNEPDDWRGQDAEHGEDCVRMGEKDGAHDLRCWFDKACGARHKYICERAAQTGRPSCNYF